MIGDGTSTSNWSKARGKLRLHVSVETVVATNLKWSWQVRVLRLVTASPIEEKILATANEKLDTEAKIIEAGDLPCIPRRYRLRGFPADLTCDAWVGGLG